MDSATYLYDSRGWLRKITWANGATLEIQYDNSGNRVSVVITCPGGC